MKKRLVKKMNKSAESSSIVKEIRKLIKSGFALVVINITDYTDYDPDRCNDGGAYSFTTRYIYHDRASFERYYLTSADMDYCPYCGCFTSTCDCEEPDIVSFYDVLDEIIKEANADKYYDKCISLEFANMFGCEKKLFFYNR